MNISESKWKKYNDAAKIIKACIDGVKLNNLEVCEKTRSTFASLFAQLIWTCPDVHTGLISPAGRTQKTEKGFATADHFRGRTGSGYVLYDQALKGASSERLTLIIASRCRVHWISSEENRKLLQTASQNAYKTKREIQEEYDFLGITLDEYVPIINRTYDYHIEGQIYISMKDIKAKYGLSDAGVDYRCKSPNYSDWQKVKIA